MSDVLGSMTDDARTALIARLETEAAFAENTNFYIRAALLREAITAMRTPVPDLYALLLESRRSHRYCEDCWYSCPKSGNYIVDSQGWLSQNGSPWQGRAPLSPKGGAA